MYLITAESFNGRKFHTYRKTDKQSKIEIDNLKKLGYTDIGMMRVTKREMEKIERIARENKFQPLDS